MSLGATILAICGMLLSACATLSSSKKSNALDSGAWRGQSVSLRVGGYRFAGKKYVKQQWQGSGVWIAEGLLATNAHVVIRGLYIDGEDDLGKPVSFDRVVALDTEKDLAILASNRKARVKPVKLVRRPKDAKGLRGTEIFALGNTAGLGLSLYRGRIVNVEQVEGNEKLIHDAAIAQGASGGPVFQISNGRLLGVNHAISHRLRFSLAIPAWKLADLMERTGNRHGVSLKALFKPEDIRGLLTQRIGKKKICADPDETTEVAIPMLQGRDLVLDIQPIDSNSGLQFGVLTKRSERVVSAKITGATRWVFTQGDEGGYTLAVTNPHKDGDPACIGVVLSTVDWDGRLN